MASRANQSPAQIEPPTFSTAHEFVTIQAGEGDETAKFLVHKNFACHYSPVLKAAFSSAFVEGQTQIYKLQDINPQVIELLVHWFYTQNVRSSFSTPQSPSEKTDEHEYYNFKSQSLCFAQLWILADRLMIPRLQNQTADLIWKTRTAGVVLDWLPFIYEHTTPLSKLRYLYATICALKLDYEEYRNKAEHFTKDILIDVVTVFSGGYDQAALYYSPRQFHVQED